jgi:hypothetical protein
MQSKSPIGTEATATSLEDFYMVTSENKGQNTCLFIKHIEVPHERISTYVRYVCHNRPHKAKPCRVRMKFGGNRRDNPNKVATKTADVPVTNVIVNGIT